ncbi:hypothetical protein Elgi_71250 [Paenibacillus elgii]|uniref:hypothetical protein n=1 Tax=Paenibacillus elgii TaxID=189691 RepID=UPI002D7B6F39|nr:hypothetical protein Elgi_71250 [Paenibacillus elgii]
MGSSIKGSEVGQYPGNRMMGMISIEQLFQNMKEVSQQLIDLEITEENVPLLEELQLKQNSLRASADELFESSPQNPLPDNLVKLIQECMELEQIFMAKLQSHYAEFAFQIQNFKNASMANQRYQSYYAQTEGYFVDEQK